MSIAPSAIRIIPSPNSGPSFFSEEPTTSAVLCPDIISLYAAAPIAAAEPISVSV